MRSNSFETFKPIFNHGFSYLIFIASLYNKTSQFLWEYIIQTLFLKILFMSRRHNLLMYSKTRFLICSILSFINVSSNCTVFITPSMLNATFKTAPWTIKVVYYVRIIEKKCLSLLLQINSSFGVS